ncbi:hypothetical protein [Nocardioides sp.]|uniref:hypothetical protein n=1 Tax=Nocardioides sp. TaxID=35761 RepID=UPI0031FF03F5|nr:hypothetical protein [Nocardioides sp.]
MTEKLKTLLHERAETVNFAVPDVDALTSSGDRRVRRRRGFSVLGGVAALALVGSLASTQLGGSGGGDDDLVADDPVTARVLTWAQGSVLHTPTTSTDLGHRIRAYVSTSEGYVFTDGTGHVYSAVDGEVTEVGSITSKGPRLVADGDGTLAAWVDPSGGRPAFVVVDQSTGETQRFEEPGATEVYAVDGATAYWRDDRGAVAVDLHSGATRVVNATPGTGAGVLAAEDGALAVERGNAGDAANDGTVISRPDGDEVILSDAYGSTAVFSTDARWVSVDADEPQVFDTRSGEPVSFDLQGRVFATGFEWLDATTLVMIASKNEAGPVELLSCTVPAGTCESTVSDLGTFDDFATTFALPVGVELED